MGTWSLREEQRKYVKGLGFRAVVPYELSGVPDFGYHYNSSALFMPAPCLGLEV